MGMPGLPWTRPRKGSTWGGGGSRRGEGVPAWSNSQQSLCPPKPTQPEADRFLKQQIQLCTLASLDQGTPHLQNGSSQFWPVSLCLNVNISTLTVRSCYCRKCWWHSPTTGPRNAHCHMILVHIHLFQNHPGQHQPHRQDPMEAPGLRGWQSPGEGMGRLTNSTFSWVLRKSVLVQGYYSRLRDEKWSLRQRLFVQRRNWKLAGTKPPYTYHYIPELPKSGPGPHPPRSRRSADRERTMKQLQRKRGEVVCVHTVRQCGEEDQKESKRSSSFTGEGGKASTVAAGRGGHWGEPDGRKIGVVFLYIT